MLAATDIRRSPGGLQITLRNDEGEIWCFRLRAADADQLVKAMDERNLKALPVGMDGGFVFIPPSSDLDVALIARTTINDSPEVVFRWPIPECDLDAFAAALAGHLPPYAAVLPSHQDDSWVPDLPSWAS